MKFVWIHRFETTKFIVAEQDSRRPGVPGFLGCPGSAPNPGRETKSKISAVAGVTGVPGSGSALPRVLDTEAGVALSLTEKGLDHRLLCCRGS